MPLQQQIQIILAKLSQYSERQRPKIELNELPTTNAQDFVLHINRQLQKQSQLLDQAVKQMIQYFGLFYQTYLQQVTKSDQLNKLLQTKTNKLDEIGYQLANLQKQNKNLEEKNLMMEEQISVHKLTIQQLERNFQQERSLFKQKLIQQQSFSQKNLQVVQSIKQQNISINQSFRQTFNQRNQLEQQVALLREEIKSRNIEITKKQYLLDWELKKKQKLNEVILQKQSYITELQQQNQSLRQALKNPFGDLNSKLRDLFIPPEEPQTHQQQVKPNKDKVKLSQDVGKQLVYQNKSQIDIKNKQPIQLAQVQRSKSKQLPKQPQMQKSVSKASKINIKKLNIDPYYCHYVLLSQTIKITEEVDDFFNIDIKPYYKNIISQKIPMYEWREWIIDKFYELVQKNNKKVGKKD